MIIRTAKHDDLEFIISSQLAMALETEGMQLQGDIVKMGASAVINDPRKGTYYLCENDDGALCGMLLTVPEWSDWRNGTVLWIHSVYVQPSFRKLGVYKKLYQHLLNMVETSSQYRGLRLYVDKRNIAAQNVYKQLGMTNQHYELYEWLKDT